MDLDDPAAVAYIEDGVRSWPVGRMQTWAFLVANVPLADAQRFAWDGHTLLAHAAEGPGTVRKDRKTYETKPDGNAVDIEEQMLKLSQTSQDFNMVTSLYRKNVSLIKSVLARGN